MFDITKFFKKIDVLDHGFVELIDGMVQDPRLKIVNAARVSFAKESKEISDKDIKLVKFLKEHGHFSTFRHSYFSFRVKAPLFVFRQLWKYQIGSHWEELENTGSIIIPDTSFNEMSGRYVEFEPEFHIPEVIRIQSQINKQGSSGKLELIEGQNPVDWYREVCNSQYKKYQIMLQAGGAKEQARSLLPQNIYSTCIWTMSTQTILHVLQQRLDHAAQPETQAYAKGIKDLLDPIFEPIELFQAAQH